MCLSYTNYANALSDSYTNDRNCRNRVLKTKGLRVIDGSVMPRIPSGHLNTPTVMIGEMGSAFILNG